jgi:hypothetical protein
VLAEYAALRKLIDAYTPVASRRSPIQIFSGEWGYPANTNRSARPAGLPLLTQAKYLSRMWLSNAVAGVPVSIWFQYVDPPQWTGLALHGAVQLDWTNNASSPHTPKPAFIAATVLQKALGAKPCTGRIPAVSAFYGGTWRTNPQAFVVGFGLGGTPTAFAVWLTDVMPDDGLQCADIVNKRQAAAYNTEELCEEGGGPLS